jgi:hypothetical protein
MIELTHEQRQQLDGPDPVEARDPVTHETYVLVRKVTYERMRELLEDDTLLATAELVDKVIAADEALDPYLEEYQKIYNKDGQ